jgi:hypothetical protein
MRERRERKVNENYITGSLEMCAAHTKIFG